MNIDAILFLYNYYRIQAAATWQLYDDICNAYMMYDFYMCYVAKYEEMLLENL